MEKLPGKVGKYKNCDDYGEASVDVDQDADVALHFLQITSIHMTLAETASYGGRSRPFLNIICMSEAEI